MTEGSFTLVSEENCNDVMITVTREGAEKAGFLLFSSRLHQEK